MLSAFYHVQVVWTSYKSNTLRTCFQKMSCGIVSCNIAIGNNLRYLIRQTSTRKHHGRNTLIAQLLYMTIVNGILCQTNNYSLHMKRKEILYRTLLKFTTLMAIRTKHRIAQLRGITFYTIQYCCVIMGNKIRHNHTNNMWCFLA